MSKTAALNLITALTQKTTQPFFAVEFLFDTAPLRLWTGVGTRTIGGETYTGTGAIQSFDGIEEVMDMSATSFSIKMDGISSSILSLALDEDTRNRKCSVYLGEKSVSDVIYIGGGLIDAFDWNDTGETCQITVYVETILSLGERSSNWRYTSESHKKRFEGDTFFDQVTSIQDVQIKWGQE